mmetsp:Transcript_71456/g.209825  ORF Transcript_71456/g.209825 Transcript_71456/m.209825 type:complete len:210 (+) Transcript_71456:279-908(+)
MPDPGERQAGVCQTRPDLPRQLLLPHRGAGQRPDVAPGAADEEGGGPEARLRGQRLPAVQRAGQDRPREQGEARRRLPVPGHQPAEGALRGRPGRRRVEVRDPRRARLRELQQGHGRRRQVGRAHQGRDQEDLRRHVREVPEEAGHEADPQERGRRDAEPAARQHREAPGLLRDPGLPLPRDGALRGRGPAPRHPGQRPLHGAARRPDI